LGGYGNVLLLPTAFMLSTLLFVFVLFARWIFFKFKKITATVSLSKLVKVHSLSVVVLYSLYVFQLFFTYSQYRKVLFVRLLFKTTAVSILLGPVVFVLLYLILTKRKNTPT